MPMSTCLGQPQAHTDCSGWDSDPESFSKRVSEHYVHTVLGQSLRAWRIVSHWVIGKEAMDVVFSDTLTVGVSFVKVPDYVSALRLGAQPVGPVRHYIYFCAPDRNLVLKEHPKFWSWFSHKT